MALETNAKGETRITSGEMRALAASMVRSFEQARVPSDEPAWGIEAGTRAIAHAMDYFADALHYQADVLSDFPAVIKKAVEDAPAQINAELKASDELVSKIADAVSQRFETRLNAIITSINAYQSKRLVSGWLRWAFVGVALASIQDAVLISVFTGSESFVGAASSWLLSLRGLPLLAIAILSLTIWVGVGMSANEDKRALERNFRRN